MGGLTGLLNAMLHYGALLKLVNEMIEKRSFLGELIKRYCTENIVVLLTESLYVRY